MNARDILPGDMIATASGALVLVGTVDVFPTAVRVTRADGWASWHAPADLLPVTREEVAA